jgi:signal transduction histidine kinase
MSASANRHDGPAEILLVDDDERSRRLLEGYLRPEGYHLRCAPDGAAALAMVHERVPDLILLDVMMPGMSGLEVCRALKSHPSTRTAQVMMVTALVGSGDQVEGLDTGADDYVAKPVRREEFLAKVRALLRVRRLIVDLEEARADLAARNHELEMKKTLAETLVHDLKNPLSAILGNLELMSAREPDEWVTRCIGRSQQAARRMNKMILDLLDVEGLEEGRYTLQAEPLDPRSLISESIDEARAAAAKRGVEIRLREVRPSARMEADPSLLRRTLDNLIGNAITHSPEGGTVTVSVLRREEGVEIAIADQGPGVPEEFRDTIFEKYARLELREAGITANRGLGLTLCRLAVENHGGTLWVEDAPGGGALFRAVFPADEREEAASASTRQAAGLPA